MTPLHWAAMGHDQQVTEFLLKEGAQTGVFDDLFGSAPLTLTVARGLRPQVEILLANGADQNLKDRGGKSPLQRARERGDSEIVDLLVKFGAKE